ncbi:MAG: hypothetical protein ACT4TC_15405 [Myxococcaceae bacterium]
MRYTVRTPDGELSYPTFADVAKAYRQGLVDADDEVREEGGTAWRKAGALPELRDVRPDAPSIWTSAQIIPVALAVVIGCVALYVMVIRESYLTGVFLLVADGLILTRVAARAYKKR